MTRIDAGALAENTVFKNLLKIVKAEANIKFWRLKYGVEVDFIIDEDEKIPIEVISTGISSFLKNYGTKMQLLPIRRYQLIGNW